MPTRKLGKKTESVVTVGMTKDVKEKLSHLADKVYHGATWSHTIRVLIEEEFIRDLNKEKLVGNGQSK